MEQRADAMNCGHESARPVRPRCGFESPLATVRRAHAGPAVAHLMIVHAGIVGRNVQSDDLGRQASDRGKQGVGSDHPVTLGADQRHACVDQFLLRVEDVERGALADTRLFAHAVERNFRRLHLRLRRIDIGLRCLELAP